MSLLPTSTDYSDKDFDSLRLRVFDLIRSVFPTWTADAVANFGNILVESFTWLMDILCFYQDQHAREGRIVTLQLRRSMIAIAKLINYELPGASAATCDVLLTITNADQLTGTVTPVSTPVVVKTNSPSDPVRGELQGSVSFNLSLGETSKTFAWEHSITQAPLIVPATGKPDQQVVMPAGPFLDDSDSVSTPTQGAFTKVSTFYSSGPSDTHYRVQVDQNDIATYIFGDGINGVKPVGNITNGYKTGGGILGEVEENTLVRVETQFRDSNGNVAYVTATNPARATGGWTREEVAAARVNAPQSITVINRTVCRTDFEINAKRVPGVGRALFLTSNELPSIGENRGKLWIIPKTGGTPSSTMLQAVRDIVTLPYPNGYPKTTTFQIEVLPAAYLTIDIIAVIWLRENQTPSLVKQYTLEDLEDFFEPMMADGTQNPNVDFGFYYKDEDGNPAGEIAFSDIFNVVRDMSGIRKVGAGETEFTLNGLRDDVQIPNYKFPALGNVTIINGATGNEI